MLSSVVTLEPQLPELLQPIESSSGPIAFVRSPEWPRYPRQRLPQGRHVIKVPREYARSLLKSRDLSPVYSANYKRLISQLLCIYTLTNARGVLANRLLVIPAWHSRQRSSADLSGAWHSGYRPASRAVSHTSDGRLLPAQARMPDGVALQAVFSFHQVSRGLPNVRRSPWFLKELHDLSPKSRGRIGDQDIFPMRYAKAFAADCRAHDGLAHGQRVQNFEPGASALKKRADANRTRAASIGRMSSGFGITTMLESAFVQARTSSAGFFPAK